MIYKRDMSGSRFAVCLTLPKADGATWGYRCQIDLIPCVGIRSSRERVSCPILQRLVRLIHTLLPGVGELVCFVGPGAAGLQGISLPTDRRVSMARRFHPVTEPVGRALLPDFELIPDDLLSLDGSRQWPTMVCLPLFEAETVEDRLLDHSELARRRQGKRSRSARWEEIWLEQAHRQLREDGTLLIVLNNSFLSNASSRSSLVRLRKRGRPPEAYQLFMAELSESDFEHIRIPLPSVGVVQEIEALDYRARVYSQAAECMFHAVVRSL